jgi:hypothetical protein
MGIGGTYLAQETKAVTSPIPQVKVEQLSPLENARRAVIGIALPDTRTAGSATLVSRINLGDGAYRYRAITAHHVVDRMAESFAENKQDASHAMVLMLQTNFHEKPIHVELDIDDISWAIPSHDWAAFQFTYDGKLSCAEVATESEFRSISAFDDIYAIGCGAAYGPFVRRGNMGATHNESMEIFKRSENTYPWDIMPEKFFRPYVNAWYGDSGGAILNKDGKLIGVINAFGFMTSSWGGSPVTHSTVSLKAHVIRDMVSAHEDYFLIED